MITYFHDFFVLMLIFLKCFFNFFGIFDLNNSNKPISWISALIYYSDNFQVVKEIIESFDENKNTFNQECLETF